MTGRTVYRYEIPVDDGVHELEFTGPILHVAARREDTVEVWHLHNPGEPARTRYFRVHGTGHPVPDGKHVGTALTPARVVMGSVVTPPGQFVWHLFEVDGPC